MGVKKDRNIQFPFAADVTFRVAEAALRNLDFSVTEVDPSEGFLAAKNGFSLASYGEKITIKIASVSPSETRAYIVSQAAMPTQLIDYGKNEGNINKIESEMRRLFGANPSNGSSGYLSPISGLSRDGAISVTHDERRKPMWLPPLTNSSVQTLFDADSEMDEFSRALNEINRKYNLEVQAAQSDYNTRMSSNQARMFGLLKEFGDGIADWTSPSWQEFSYFANSFDISAGVRFGTAVFKSYFDSWEVPALVPILNQGNLFLIGRGAAKKECVQALQSIVLRLTATFNPAKLRYTFIDAVGLGANLAGFMHLPELMRSRAWTETRHIEQQLLDITEHMENIIQKYLRNDYPTMEAYNDEAGEVAEPYRFLVVVNFPAGFSDDSAKRLLRIASNGPRAGVYVVCSIDGDLPLPYGFNLPDLLRTGAVVETVDQKDFMWDAPHLVVHHRSQ